MQEEVSSTKRQDPRTKETRNQKLKFQINNTKIGTKNQEDKFQIIIQ